MDIDLVRTYLAVVEQGSFVDAADKVYVTQSTVSMRIKSLEERLGRTLFERGKSGAKLTPAGRQFQKHAEAFVRIWSQASAEVALPEGHDRVFAIGGQYSLWDGYLLRWVTWMRETRQDVALRTHLGHSAILMRNLADGVLDLAVLYRPDQRPGFRIEKLFEEQLVLVSSVGSSRDLMSGNYVLIDWGPEFLADHTLNFPELVVPGLTLGLGSLAINYLLENSASGYLPRRVAERYLADGRLHRIDPAPDFFYPAYAVFPGDKDEELYETALKGLREMSRSVTF